MEQFQCCSIEKHYKSRSKLYSSNKCSSNHVLDKFTLLVLKKAVDARDDAHCSSSQVTTCTDANIRLHLVADMYQLVTVMKKKKQNMKFIY